jgi:hypothetical protein
MFMFGSGGQGQLGTGMAEECVPSPVKVGGQLGDLNVTHASCGSVPAAQRSVAERACASSASPTRESTWAGGRIRVPLPMTARRADMSTLLAPARRSAGLLPAADLGALASADCRR